MIWLVTAILSVVCSIAAAELLDLCPWLTEKLLMRAAQRVPFRHRERYIAEWRAEHDYMRTRCGKLAIVAWAVGVYATSARLAAEVPQIKRRLSANLVQMSLFSDPPTLTADTAFDVPAIDIPTVIRQEPPDSVEHVHSDLNPRHIIVGTKGTGKTALYGFALDLDRSRQVARLFKRWKSRK